MRAAGDASDDAAIKDNQRNGDVRPIPDPTRLTTENLNREITSLRELLTSAQVSSRETIETRLDANDKAIELIQHGADRFPARVDEKVTALRDLHEQRIQALIETLLEKFSSIQTQFRERDVRTEQSSKDSKVAVDAALQAAKEAVGEQNKSSALAIAKSETSTTKQIDQLATQIMLMTKGFDDKLNDVKDRLTRLEGVGVGERRSVISQQGSNSNLIAIAGVVFGLLIGVAGIIFAVLKP
jgi:hypothetical protein